MSSLLPPNILIATRKTPLALAQTYLAQTYLQSKLPSHSFSLLPLSTSGDRHLNWSLQQQGGKGLFTKELEDALLSNAATLAVHSAKDLPTELPQGLTIAGYLPREIPTDTLITRSDTPSPSLIATGSPRRRAQIAKLFPNASFTEIRGSVETRLQKIQQGLAQATILASAGLKRLNIASFPGLSFKELPITTMVPAVGQAAIAIETTSSLAPLFTPLLDPSTHYAVSLERAFLSSLGGGCQTPFAAHYSPPHFYIFHENSGLQIHSVPPNLPPSQLLTLASQLASQFHH